MSESSTSSYASNANAMELAGKIMVVAILILLFVLLIVLFFHLYARWFYSRRQQPLYEITVVSYAPTRGLDPILLKALPVVKFDPEEFKHGPLLQCAVCLCEVAKGEKARLLPECDHGFHLDCINEWFRSHSTCPLCRKPVEGFPTNESRGVSTLESCLDGGSNSSSDCNNQDCVVSEPSSSSMMMSACDRAVNGGLAIDIPRETTNEEEERKSEMPAKLRSLKRLLSGDNRRVNPSIYSDVEQGEGQS